MKFLVSFTLILLYMGLWALLIWPASILLDNDMMPWLIIGLLILIVPTFPLVLDYIAKLVYKFPATNPEFVSEEELRKLLLEINNFESPITASEKGKKIIFTWKYVDAKWFEIFRKAGMTETYRLIVKLDSHHHRATLIDLQTTTNWSAGPTGFKFRASFFRGIDAIYKREIIYAINEAFKPGKVVDYRFVTNEIKDPVMNTIRAAGWDVHFGLF